MKAAILDLGTNTFHLLAVRFTKAETFDILFKKQYVVKLGEGGINQKYIAEPAFARGIETLKSIRKELDKQEIEQVKAVATSAIRTARNGMDFIRQALEEARIQVQTITGDEEAAYIYEGVKRSVSVKDNYLVMDIGGGSVEFIIGNKQKLLWKQSFPIGAARLIEVYHSHDPILKGDVEALHDFLYLTLKPLYDALKIFPVHTLVGAAGSFESIYDLSGQPENPSPSLEFPIERFHEIYRQLLVSDAAQRAMMPGLANFRIEMIVVASALIKHILDSCNIHQLYISKYSLKEGVLFTEF